MQFSTKEDIKAPAHFVFEQITDFPAFESMAMRRGVTLRRLSGNAVPAVGTGWEGEVPVRGRTRTFSARVSQCTPPDMLEVTARSEGFDITLVAELTPIGPNQTRMRVAVDIRPRTLPARLMMQSAKLAKARLTRRYKTRIRTYADHLSSVYRRRATRSA